MAYIRTKKVTIRIEPDVGLTRENISHIASDNIDASETGNFLGDMRALGNGYYEIDILPYIYKLAFYRNFGLFLKNPPACTLDLRLEKSPYEFLPQSRIAYINRGCAIKAGNTYYDLGEIAAWNSATTTQKLAFFATSANTITIGSLSIPKNQIKEIYLDSVVLLMPYPLEIPNYFFAGLSALEDFTLPEFHTSVSTEIHIGNYFFAGTRVTMKQLSGINSFNGKGIGLTTHLFNVSPNMNNNKSYVSSIGTYFLKDLIISDYTNGFVAYIPLRAEYITSIGQGFLSGLSFSVNLVGSIGGTGTIAPSTIAVTDSFSGISSIGLRIYVDGLLNSWRNRFSSIAPTHFANP